MDRRQFLHHGILTGAAITTSGAGLLPGCDTVGPSPLTAGTASADLFRPEVRRATEVELVARQRSAEIGAGVTAPVLSWSDGPVGPTIEGRRGERVSITMLNELSEPTIAHWHGIRPPELMDGHPRLAVGPGGRYDYEWELDEPAGLYWYHSHAHRRTGPQVYYGLAGLFIVRDEVEDGLGLPSGDRELAIVLQDKRQAADGRLVYGSMGPQMMEGFLGDAAFVNGRRGVRVEVEAGLYRLRVLGAGNARIYRLALSNGAPLRLIGTDGGFLDRVHELPWVDVGTGERVDLLVDFSDLPVGTSVRLRSLAFPDPGTGMGMGMMGRGMMGGMGGLPQGSAMDLLEFAVTGRAAAGGSIPRVLPPFSRIDRSEASRERTFRFNSWMMSHTINGRSFAMDRIDERVPFGATEIWRFINDAPFPHPVHMHAVHFQVLSRTGGRGRIFPWETGWKDTVLVFPGEEVEVIARFDRHRGIFLLHCHNLEHEDAGMMMNFAIE